MDYFTCILCNNNIYFNEVRKPHLIFQHNIYLNSENEIKMLFVKRFIDEDNKIVDKVKWWLR